MEIAWVVTSLFLILAKTDSAPIKVIHVITGLGIGGAETMLYKLLVSSKDSIFDMHVICLSGYGPIGKEIQSLGVSVKYLNIQSPFGVLKGVIKICNCLIKISPDIIQGWMYHGNLAAWFGKLMVLSSAPLFWGIRQSLHNHKSEKRGTILVIKFCSFISRFASKIIYNSEVGRVHHEQIGYTSFNGVVIPNGFFTDIFSPDTTAPYRLRSQLGLSNNVSIVGMVARFDPIKGHSNFLAAAVEVIKKKSNTHFVFIGRDVDLMKSMLAQDVKFSCLKNKIHLLGEVRNISSLVAGFDVSVTPSISEGFANAIGEAMSCGVPCVVTNVGDSAKLVGDCGLVVSSNDSIALSDAILDLLEMSHESRAALGTRARQRIINQFSIDAITRRYELLYKSVLGFRRT